MRGPAIRAALGASFAVLFTAAAVLQSAAASTTPDAVMLAAAGFATLAAALVVGVSPRSALALGRDAHLRGAAAGILLAALPTAAVLLTRSSDAPSGANVLFATSAVWGLAAVAVAAAAGRLRPAAPAAVSMLALALAGAFILANWERPSSFSPFVRFTFDEVVMAAAGISWACGLVLAARLAEDEGRRAATTLVAAWAGAAMAGGGALALMAGGIPGALDPGQWLLAAPFAVATGALVALTPAAVAGVGPARLGGCAAIAPALVSVLAIVERLTGLQAPRPMLESQVALGCLLAAGALAAVWSTAERPAGDPSPADPARDDEGLPRPGPRTLTVFGLASLPALLALVGMSMPALSVHLAGTLGEGRLFDATVVWPGLEALLGWGALVASLALCAGAWRALRADVPRAVALFLLAGGAALACVVLRGYPMHAWIPSMPPEVQQDLGTEYASLTVTALPAVASVAAAALSGAGAALGLAALAWRALASGRSAGRQGVAP